MLRPMTLRRQMLVVATLLAAALACWIVLLRGMSVMGGVTPFVAVWVTSTAAMMLPSALPMVVAYAGFGRGRASTPAFVLGTSPSGPRTGSRPTGSGWSCRAGA